MPPLSRSPALLAVSLGLLAACGGSPGGDPAALAMQVDTLGDTVRVRITGGSAWGDTATLVPEMTIGVADGPEEYLLGRVRSLAVSPAGEVYVMDGQVPALRKYAADGTYLGTLGREGSGPGEYRRPDGGLAVLSDGRVVLRDPGNSRMAVYAADGSYLEQWPINGTFSTSRQLYRDDRDGLYTMVLAETDLPPWQWKYGLAHYLPDGTLVDTIPMPDWEYEPPMIRGQREGNSSSNTVPFTAEELWSFLTEGAAIGGVATDYAFSIFRPGRILRVERDWSPVPVHPDEAEERKRLETFHMVQNFPGWTWNGVPIPGTKPAYRGFFPGERGRVWVWVPTAGRPYRTAAEAAAAEAESERPELRFREAMAFDVFEPDGRYLGHVRAPEGFQRFPAPVFRGDSAWAVSEDPETGIPQVVRYRIQH